MRTSSVSGIHAVRNAIGNAAPSAKLAPSGRGGASAGRPRRAPRTRRAMPRAKPHDAVAVELARDLGPEHGRELRHLRVLPAPHEHVREVDPAGLHLETLPLARDGRAPARPGATSCSGPPVVAEDDRSHYRPRELRLALLEERGHALGSVLRLEAAAEALRLAAQALLEREVARRPRELAQDGDRHRRALRDRRARSRAPRRAAPRAARPSRRAPSRTPSARRRTRRSCS